MVALGKKILEGTDSFVKDPKKAADIWFFAAELDNASAINNIGLLGAWFATGKKPCTKDIPLSIKLLKMAATKGNKQALQNLESISAHMCDSDPKAGYELLDFCVRLGSLGAKRNLAICLIYGKGVNSKPNRGFRLLKECLLAGHKTALKDIANVGANYITGESGLKKDVTKGIWFLQFAALKGQPLALKNLNILINGLLKGSPQITVDVVKGAKVLAFLAREKDNHEARSLLKKICELDVPFENPYSIERESQCLNLYGLKIVLPKPERPRHPLIENFLRDNNITVRASENGYISFQTSGVFSSDDIAPKIEKLKEQMRQQAVRHAKEVTVRLEQYLPYPLVNIVCEYIPDDVSPMFIQYKKASKAVRSQARKLNISFRPTCVN